MWIVELRSLSRYLLPSCDTTLPQVPSKIRANSYRHYGSGSHASSRRNILGSVQITAKSDQVIPIQIRHLIIEGSSQWVFGRNVTWFCNIHHIDKSCLIFRSPVSTEWLSMTLYGVGDHCYLLFYIFNITHSEHADNCIISRSCSAYTSSLLWSHWKNIRQRAPTRLWTFILCRHQVAALKKPDLEWAKCYISITYTRNFSGMCHFKALIGWRKVSLSSMSRDFSDLVCADIHETLKLLLH